MAPIDAVFTGIERWKEYHLDLVDSGKISIVHGAQDVRWNCQGVYTQYKIRMIYKPAPEIAPVMIDRAIWSDEIEACNLPVLHVMVILDDMLEALCSSDLIEKAEGKIGDDMEPAEAINIIKDMLESSQLLPWQKDALGVAVKAIEGDHRR